MYSYSKNVYKSGWVVVSNEDKCVIDSNSRLAKRIEELEERRLLQEREAFLQQQEESEEGGEPEFVGGLGGEEIDALLADNEGVGSNIIKGAGSQSGVDVEEAQAQAQEILEEAQAQADEIRESAHAEIEAMSMKAKAEANQRGFDEGYKQGLAQVDEMKRELEAERARLNEEYEQLVERLEPRFVDTITDVYSHIFGVDLMENRDILLHLVDATLRRVESSRTFIVHVSKEDYPYVNMQKQALVEGAINGKGMVEIIEDITLGKGDCLIETDGGIFDCGIGTQLEGLTKKLQVLSFDGSNH